MKPSIPSPASYLQQLLLMHVAEDASLFSLLQYNSLSLVSFPLFPRPLIPSPSPNQATWTRKFSYLLFTYSHVSSFPWEASTSSPLVTPPTLAVAPVAHRSRAHGDSPSILFEIACPIPGHHLLLDGPMLALEGTVCPSPR
jgi:hypothetical protein